MTEPEAPAESTSAPLTEAVTLPKDPTPALSTPASTDAPPAVSDKPVAAVLDLQLVPQLREEQLKNERLEAALQQKQHEVDSLREIADAAVGLKAQDTETNRIIELSKRNRGLNLMLEREKQKAAGLAAELQKVQLLDGVPAAGTDPKSPEAACRAAVEKAAAAAEAAQKECVSWKHKHEAALERTNQLEVKLSQLRAERDKLERALVREVGSDVPMAKLLADEGGDWRGRAQQIGLLRDKVRELQESQGLAAVTVNSRYNREHQRNIDSIKADRMKELERLRAELESSSAKQAALQAKLDGTVARKTIVEGEVKSLKEKMGILLDKAATDDKLVAALQSEIAALRKSLREAGSAEDFSTMQRQIESLKGKYAEQVEMISQQESLIASLQGVTPAGLQQ
eukprot:jgi/Astpho2/2894/Aster-x0116